MGVMLNSLNTFISVATSTQDASGFVSAEVHPDEHDELLRMFDETHERYHLPPWLVLRFANGNLYICHEEIDIDTDPDVAVTSDGSHGGAVAAAAEIIANSDPDEEQP